LVAFDPHLLMSDDFLVGARSPRPYKDETEPLPDHTALKTVCASTCFVDAATWGNQAILLAEVATETS